MIQDAKYLLKVTSPFLDYVVIIYRHSFIFFSSVFSFFQICINDIANTSASRISHAICQYKTLQAACGIWKNANKIVKKKTNILINTHIHKE